MTSDWAQAHLRLQSQHRQQPLVDSLRSWDQMWFQTAPSPPKKGRSEHYALEVAPEELLGTPQQMQSLERLTKTELFFSFQWWQEDHLQSDQELLGPRGHLWLASAPLV